MKNKCSASPSYYLTPYDKTQKQKQKVEIPVFQKLYEKTVEEKQNLFEQWIWFVTNLYGSTNPKHIQLRSEYENLVWSEMIGRWTWKNMYLHQLSHVEIMKDFLNRF